MAAANRFIFSGGDGDSLAMAVFNGLTLNRESNSEFRELFDLKVNTKLHLVRSTVSSS